MTDDDLLAVLRKVARPVACPTGGVGYGLWLNGAPYWHLTGFTVDTAAKGIVLDASPHVTVDGVEVRNIGDEGVHFRKGSADGVIRNSFVHDAGQNQPDYGVVSGNTFNGSGEQNQNSADSAIDAKGDGYRIDGNTVTDPYLDGFQTHTAQSPYGCGNTFSGNKFTVTASDGYGINVTNNSKSKCGGSSPNVVHASNTSTGGKGLTNITVATP
ncbi:right-handed parallel beta-helix repeat-containing protein [Streptomyces sp. NBC_01198]|uniref:right-handed parallel beta-helix repeat-containing protein n=1 Tax=Streptomyces sp. NBC_01198 TaxID=2903769 RepID=UPI002E0D1EE2|nr:right-handed parallel beta-helix repeat-containing protein [Streptomyces sp. NBC_01198]